MLSQDLRKEWCFNRFQYYVSGRSNIFLSNFYAAGILLGYAVETSYKHLLLELGTDVGNKILNSHSTRQLNEYLMRNYPGQCPAVSDEFLDYVDDHLEARYPSQRLKVVSRLKDRLYVMNYASLSFYDDLMFQLDKLLFQSCSDYCSSIYFRAGTEVLLQNGISFFHGNYLAFLNLNLILSYLTAPTQNSSEINFLKNNQMMLYNHPSISVKAQSIINASLSFGENFSSQFVYPEFDETGSVTLNNPLFLAVNCKL